MASRKRARAEEEEEEEPKSPIQPSAASKKKAKNTKAKKAKGDDEVSGRAARPEDLEPGALVLYWDGWRGKIQDSFEELDKFWVEDEETGEVVRDENGKIIDFSSADLWLVTPSAGKVLAEEGAPEGATPKGGILLLGTEQHMMQMLEHFGTPNYTERTTPQQPLAIPCHMCEPENLPKLGQEGVEEGLRSLASTLREDIPVAVRTYHLKQAFKQLQPDLVRLQDYFCLSTVHLPFSWKDIEASSSSSERRQREEVWNQIDLCVTAEMEAPDGVTDSAQAARIALGEYLGVEVADVFWEREVQVGIRKRLGVEVLPLEFVGATGYDTKVVILPRDAVITKIQGLLCFAEAPGVDYTSNADDKAEGNPIGKKSDSSGESKVGGKTVREWEKEQSQFPGPKLPPGWLRIRSSSGQVYYWNKHTQEATFKSPAPVEDALPPGWTKQVSKSTGKIYYFHAGRNKSVFERPTA